MSGQLSVTEALLAQAAAESPAEVHAARLALISSGGHVTRPMDRTLLASGDGTAGNELLGGARQPAHGWPADAGPSCAVRSYRLLQAADRAAARTAREAS